MANMSYCRFQNTLSDLQDCVDNMENKDLSKDEKRARKAIIELCCNVADWYGSEDEDEDEES